MLHRLAHLLHWQHGTIESAPDPNNPTQFFIYFLCAKCGRITGVTAVKYENMVRW